MKMNLLNAGVLFFMMCTLSALGADKDIQPAGQSAASSEGINQQSGSTSDQTLFSQFLGEMGGAGLMLIDHGLARSLEVRERWLNRLEITNQEKWRISKASKARGNEITAWIAQERARIANVREHGILASEALQEHTHSFAVLNKCESYMK